MKEMIVYGRKYVPALTADNKLQMWPMVSWGTGVHKGQMVLSVYVLAKAHTAQHNAPYRSYRHICIMRQTMAHGTSHAEQRQVLEVMCNAAAIQQECNYVLLREAKLK